MLSFVNIRLIALAALSAVLVFGTYYVKRQWDRGQAAIVEAQELRKTLAAERAAKVAADKASEGYQDELERLRNRPARVRTVRLCSNPASVPPAQPGSTGTGTAGGLGDAGTGQDSGRSEPANEPANIGPDLYALAARCDALTAQLRGLQGFHVKP